MKRIIITVLLTLSILIVDAQVQKLAGPRVGLTMVQAGSLASILRKDVDFFSDEVREEWTGSTGKYGAVMSQYGWQWESRFADGGDVTGIVEWIALVGGMEKGMFLPSVSSMVGVRTAKGIEFAVGPNLSIGGIAMVIGAGYNFKFGKLNLPVNIAYVPSMDKTYTHEAVYDHTHLHDSEGNALDPVLKHEGYEVTHPTGARVSIMVGFNLTK
tara:strand:+ start:5455 stop:6093 length:639 start_codon:yes stop_codon:yes gene_type:complete